MSVAIVSYDQLSYAQREWMTNGCGPRRLDFLVPDLLFNEACNRHDFDYWLGYTEQHRRNADWRFLQNMLKACATQPKWRRLVHQGVACCYWAGVRLLGNIKMFGKVPFHFRNGFATWEDLDIEMGMGNRVDSERRFAAAHRLRWWRKGGLR